jgi:hypothetical protein
MSDEYGRIYEHKVGDFCKMLAQHLVRMSRRMDEHFSEPSALLRAWTRTYTNMGHLTARRARHNGHMRRQE